MSVRELWQRVGRKRMWLGVAVVLMVGLALALVGRVPNEVNAPPKPLVRVELGVKLFPATGQLHPTTTFEVRFEKSMVPNEGVGEIGPSPILFKPAIPGRFLWHSTRSGIFTPTNGFKLAETYEVRLRPKLRDFEGKGSKARLQRTFWAPQMKITGVSSGVRNMNGIHNQRLEVGLAFNTSVDPNTAKEHLVFRNKNGKTMPANVQRLPAKNRWQVAAPKVSWEALFDPEAGGRVSESKPNTTRLLVFPKMPLLPGIEWWLVVSKGMPSMDKRHELAKEKRVSLGTFRPLIVNSANARNVLNEGRYVDVSLSWRSSRKIKEAELAKWVKINPEVRNIHTRQFGRTLRIQGDFELNQDYRVTLKQGLPGPRGLKLEKEWAQSVKFQMLDSAVYLPAYDDSQYAGGHRQFGFVSLNNRAVRLRVKRLDPMYLRDVVKGYREQYLAREEIDFAGGWYYRMRGALSFKSLAGQKVFEETIRLPRSPIDRVVRREIPWDQLMSGRMTGPMFVEVQAVGRDGEIHASQALVQMTDLGAVWKRTEGKIWIHVFSQKTASPLKGASLELFGEKGGVLAKADTGDSGQASLAGDGDWLLVKMGEDVHLVDLQDNNSRINLYRFGIWGEWEQNSDQMFLFTERDVYQPGDIVHLKGIIRGKENGAINLPETRRLSVLCRDPRGRAIYSGPVEITKYGSFALDIKLPEGALGRYAVKVSGEAAEEQWHSFQVQEYEAPKFKINFPSQDFEADEAVRLPLEANYYFGKPLAGAQVKWVLDGRAGNFRSKDFPNYSFGLDYRTDDEDEDIDLSKSGFGKLSATGELDIAPQLVVNTRYPRPINGTLMVRIIDMNQQTITASARFQWHSSSFYLGLRELERVQWAKQPLKLQTIAMEPDGTVRSRPVKVLARLQRVKWSSVSIKGAGGTLVYKNERELITVAESVIYTVGERDDPVNSNLIPPLAGQYQLDLRAEDASGRPVLTTTVFYVPGTRPLAWDYRNESQIELVPNKKLYRAGETAVLLLKTPIAGHALVTVERNEIVRSFNLELKGNAPVVNVPLETDDAPNVFVSVMMIRGAKESRRRFPAAEYRLGYCELKVEDPRKRLKIDVKTARPDYRPGREVAVATTVRDVLGNPIQDAEVTLYAVDEGVLDLTGYRPPNLHGRFHRNRGLSVETGTTFPQMLTENPNRLAFGNKGVLIGDGGGGGADKLRKNFLACAYWNSNLVTDSEGQVTVTFKAPDSLTRYRIYAVAHTTDHQFGTGSGAIRIRKPLMVESALPRFGRVGDVLQARALVFNQMNRKVQAVVRLELEGGINIANGKDEHTLTIPARGKAEVEIPLHFLKAGQAKTIWRVHLADDPDTGDAVQTRLDIRYAAPLRQAIHLGDVRTTSVDLLKEAAPALLEGEGVVEVNIANTRLSQLIPTAHHLWAYPYGCVEQTSSGLLAWVELKDFIDLFSRIDRPLADYRVAVNKGIERLYRMQTPSGGLGYWPGAGQPMFYGSAYAAMVLARANKVGFNFPPVMRRGLAKYLSAQLRVKHRHHASALCMALYALALLEKPEPAYHEKLFNQRVDLGPDALALLALAVHHSQGSQEMTDTLLREARRAKTDHRHHFGSTDQEIAVQLMAWSLHNPEAPELGELVALLLESRKRGHWQTTFANAWSLLALNTYSREVETRQSTVRGALVWRGQEQRFELNDTRRQATFRFNTAKGENPTRIVLLNPKKARLFTQVHLKMYPRVTETIRQNQGFSIRRTYLEITPDGSEIPASELSVGDLVRVRLHLEVNEPANYVVIDDALPATFEAVNTLFLTQSMTVAKKSKTWWCNYHELQKDRSVFFRNHLWAGKHTINYLARVRAAGSVTAPPTKVEEMYNPNRYGLSASRKIETSPVEQ